jgi:hypothetical protein
LIIITVIIIKQERSLEDSKIQRCFSSNMVHMECKSRSDTVKTGATGTISVSFRKCVSNISGKCEVKEL